MCKVRLFHGSEYIINKPVLSKGKHTNDYGQGFYCTENLDLAKEWACKNNSDGFVNEYELDYDNLRILNLLDKEYNILHWIAILLKNRVFTIQDGIEKIAKDYLLEHYLIDTSNYDIIIGYRADDSYFSYAHGFISNTIPLRNLEKALKLGELGTQVVLVSNTVFEKLVYKTSYVVFKKEFYPKYIKRDLTARKIYQEEIKKDNLLLDDIFILDIIRKGLNKDESI